MEPLTTGTLAGTGTFRCDGCGHILAAGLGEQLPACPDCAGRRFSRVALTPVAPADEEDDVAAAARPRVPAGGQALAWRADGELHVVPVRKDWTRVGRSLAADIRFDDPTVSRRHALVVRQPDAVRVVDDRSLNGVFVNGERVAWAELSDGDEIVVGRYRLRWLVGAPAASPAPAESPAT